MHNVTLWSVVFVLSASSLPNRAQAQELHLSQERLTASTPGTSAAFGAAIDAEGATAVVGAPGAGRAYVLVRAGGVWSEQAELAPSGSPGQLFGSTVAVAGDTVVVGAPDDTGGGLDAGAVFVFTRTGSTWSQAARLVSADLGFLDRFGSAVDIEGDRLAIGAKGARNGTGIRTGAAYLFERVAGSWTEQQKVHHDAAFPSAGEFGHTLALDGDDLAVGARDGSHHGSVTLFEFDGQTWTETAYLFASGTSGVSEFSSALDLSGGVLAVGSSADDHFEASNGGSAFIYEHDEATWSLTARLISHDRSTGYRFGSSIAIGSGTLVVGAAGAHFPEQFTGGAYVFELLGGVWTEAAQLLATDPQDQGRLGTALTLLDDELLIGAPYEASGPSGAGSVRTYPMPLGAPLATALGFGDGSGAACPCGNESAFMRGCRNTTFEGGYLVAAGSRSLAADDLVFEGANLKASQTALLFAGTQTIASGEGIPFGDGLRVVGGSVVRLGVRNVAGNRTARWGPGLAALGGWSPGATRAFQVWYRDPFPGACDSGFNLTQALTVTLQP